MTRNLISGKLNKTLLEKDKNKIEKIKNDKDSTYTGQFPLSPTKQPSKILGPLLAYGNKGPNETKQQSVNNHLDTLKYTNISSEENLYYKSKQNEEKPNKSDTKLKEEDKSVKYHDNSKNKDPKLAISYSDPLNSDTKQSIPNKSINKSHKSKPSKGIFVTPPSVTTNTDNYKTPLQSHPTTNSPNNVPNGVRIHGKGSPDEILKIINEHPELANYPPGSVVEIHDVVAQDIPQKPNFVNPNSIVPPNNSPPLVPYLVNQEHSYDTIPHGVGLEQFLQEIHKNIQPQTNHFIPYPTNTQYSNVNGQIYIPPQNAPAFNTRPDRNFTQPGGFL